MTRLPGRAIIGLALVAPLGLVFYLGVLIQQIRTNERSAIAALRSINTAEEIYASTYNSGFSDNLLKLASPPPQLQGLIFVEFGGLPADFQRFVSWPSDNELIVYGYKVIYSEKTVDGRLADFRVTAEPLPGGAGPSFLGDPTGTRISQSGPASASSDLFELKNLQAGKLSPGGRIAASILLHIATMKKLAMGKTPREFMWKGYFTGPLREWEKACCAPHADWADLLDPSFSSLFPGQASAGFAKNGYRFAYQPVGKYGSIQKYSCTAEPLNRGRSGRRSFFTDESGVIRANSAGSATVRDSPI